MSGLLRRLRYLLPGVRRAEEREMRAEFEALRDFAPARELGNLTLAAEDARSVWGWAWLDSFLADVRYACRMLLRQRSFTCVAALSLGLGIGANTAIYSLIDRVLWRQLPVADPDRLVTVKSSYSYFVYNRFRDLSRDVFVDAALTSRMDRDIDDRPGRVELVTGNYFQVLGVAAQAGRSLIPSDGRAAVISHRYWQFVLGGQPVLGQTIRITKVPFTIVGIAPPEFFGVTVGDAADLWIPVSNQPDIMPGRNWIDEPRTFFANLVARLRPGITLERAGAIVTPIAIRIDLDRAPANLPPHIRKRIESQQVKVLPLAAGLSSLRDRFSKPLHVLFGMVAMGLVLACVNVMGLQFARAGERRRELSVRLAIGAGRGRIVRQLLTESLLLALIGGALGLALCRPAAAAVVGLISDAGRPVRLDLSIDGRMLLFVLAVSIVSAVICGVIPALRATKGAVAEGLQSGSRGTNAAPARRASGRLAAAVQLGISVVLVGGALLFAFSLDRLNRFDTGVDRRGLRVMNIDFTEGGYKDSESGAASMRLLDRLRSLPGVKSASFSGTGLYLTRGWNPLASTDLVPPAMGWFDVVGPRYFTTIGTRILAGRDFTEQDNAASEKVAVISLAFAKYFFPDGNAVGRNVYLGEGRERERYRVIGIAADIFNNIRKEPRRNCFLAQAQRAEGNFTTLYMIRGNISAADLRAAVRAEDPAVRVVSVDSADQLLNRTIDLDRVVAALAGAFGVLALTLAAVGVYGLLACDVARRTSEIGIRMAIGATRASVVAMVLREAALVGAGGIGLGLAAALGLSRIVEGLVFELKPGDPRVLAAAASLLALVALAAALAPARKAARMDPMQALRAE